MDRETLVNIVYSGKVRFIPVRRCSLCDRYVGYKFVKIVLKLSSTRKRSIKEL